MREFAQGDKFATKDTKRERGKSVSVCVTEFVCGWFRWLELISERNQKYTRTLAHMQSPAPLQAQPSVRSYDVRVTADLVSHVQKLFHDPAAKPKH